MPSGPIAWRRPRRLFPAEQRIHMALEGRPRGSLPTVAQQHQAHRNENQFHQSPTAYPMNINQFQYQAALPNNSFQFQQQAAYHANGYQYQVPQPMFQNGFVPNQPPPQPFYSASNGLLMQPIRYAAQTPVVYYAPPPVRFNGQPPVTHIAPPSVGYHSNPIVQMPPNVSSRDPRAHNMQNRHSPRMTTQAQTNYSDQPSTSGFQAAPRQSQPSSSSRSEVATTYGEHRKRFNNQRNVPDSKRSRWSSPERRSAYTRYQSRSSNVRPVPSSAQKRSENQRSSRSDRVVPQQAVPATSERSPTIMPEVVSCHVAQAIVDGVREAIPTPPAERDNFDKKLIEGEQMPTADSQTVEQAAIPTKEVESTQELPESLEPPVAENAVEEQLIPADKIKKEKDLELVDAPPEISVDLADVDIKQEIKVEADAETDSYRDSEADTASESDKTEVLQDASDLPNTSEPTQIKEEPVDPAEEEKEDNEAHEKRKIWVKNLASMTGEIKS